MDDKWWYLHDLGNWTHLYQETEPIYIHILNSIFLYNNIMFVHTIFHFNPNNFLGTLPWDLYPRAAHLEPMLAAP